MPNLMPNHTEPSLYFTLRPNQTCQIYRKQNKEKHVHNIKYVSP